MSAQVINVPLNDELYQEVYDFIDRVVAKRMVNDVFKNTLPYSREEVAQTLIAVDKKVKSGELKLTPVEKQKLNQFLAYFSEELRALNYPVTEKAKNTYLLQTKGEKHKFGLNFGLGETVISRNRESTERQTGYATMFRPTVSGQIRDDFAFLSDFKIYYLSETQFPDIPKTEGNRIRQAKVGTATGALSSYYFKLKLPWFDLFYGKDAIHWGPGRNGALMLSENPEPINMFRLTALYPPVKFQSFTGILHSELARKYFSSHRLEYHPFKRLSVGISETLVYSERFESIYLNPLQIYLITQTSKKYFKGELQENPDNALISADIDIILLKGLELYGELLVDECQPFSVGIKNWSSKFGVLLGGYWVDPFSFSDTDFRVEYAFVNQYTYTHHRLSNAYTHFDKMIGHKIGTDADDFWIYLKHWFTANIATSITYELEQHGEGSVNKPHSKDAPQDDEWEFLSGVTESTHSITLDASYNMIGKYSVELQYKRSWLRNASNQAGINDTNDQVLVSGQYRF